MATKVILPKQGLQMTEGTITNWLVKEGGKVVAGQPLFEMETDKLTITIDAECDGTMLKIIRGENEVVPITETIAIVGEPGEDITALLPAGVAAPAAAPAAKAETPVETKVVAAAPAVDLSNIKATKVILPKQGLQMTEGTITKWLVKEGEKVVSGQPLFEMETDKLTITIDAECDGTMLKIVRGENEVVPITDPFLIDRITAIAGNQNVPVLICINKSDLSTDGNLADIYRQAGYDVILTSAVSGMGLDELREKVKGKTVAFTGNSGVGKSSILNALSPGLSLKTGEVSTHLSRGRHTTRHIELYPLDEYTWVADTPGFSSFDTDQMEIILKESLQFAFPDFSQHIGKCQFHDCAHMKEPGCKVIEALQNGQIQRTRYDSYVRMYEKAKEIKAWELK